MTIAIDLSDVFTRLCQYPQHLRQPAGGQLPLT
jgi:hypothetical protein